MRRDEERDDNVEDDEIQSQLTTEVGSFNFSSTIS